MIGWLGILQRKQATKDYDKIDIKPYERTDDIVVDWKKICFNELSRLE